MPKKKEQTLTNTNDQDIPYNIVLSPQNSFTKGTLALSICPGRKDDKHYRDTQRDLIYLRKHFNVIVSLQYPYEYNKYGMGDYPTEVRRYGFIFYNFPIIDRKAPTLEELINITNTLGPLLQRPEYHILIHCYGGLGRSGTIAAALALHFGIIYNQVIDFIRSNRPRAIQTQSQKDILLAYYQYLKQQNPAYNG